MRTIVLALFALLLSLNVEARTSGSHSTSSDSRAATSSHTRASSPKSHGGPRKRPEKCASCERDSKGRIYRSTQARHAFQKSNPCPATGKTKGACPGYVIDHKQALKHGGADQPSNMQWQTTAEAKAKDRVE
jgi:hypothetical protein